MSKTVAREERESAYTSRVPRANASNFAVTSVGLARKSSNTPTFDDTFTTVVSKKVTADIVTPEGKEQLRSEIIAQLNDQFSRKLPGKYRVTNVYFTDLVIQ